MTELTRQLILVADDDPVVRHILSAILEQRGYEVSLTESGVQCLELVQTFVASGRLPCLIFLDFFLGDMNGLDVLAQLKNTPAISLIPVIILSANTEKDMKAIRTPEHAYHYLEKPFKPENVYRALGEALARPF